MDPIPSSSVPHAIFLHIPKTGGSTLDAILNRAYPIGQIFRVNNEKPLQSEAFFTQLAPEHCSSIRVVRGHFAFGLHAALPHPATYVTLLRHPVERVISYYHYLRAKSNHRLHQHVHRHQWTLTDLLHRGATTEMDNGQTRLIAGVGDTVPFGACTASMLETAQANIDNHFSVVGLTHRFDETLLLIKHALDWRHWPFYTRRNVNRTRPPLQDISQDTIALIEQHNQLDLQLYAAASQRFDEQLDSLLSPTDVRQFQMLNQRYASFLTPYWRMRSALQSARRSLFGPAYL